MIALRFPASIGIVVLSLIINSTKAQFIDGGQQTVTTPAWTTDASHDVLWVRFSSTGVIIVCTTNELSGFDASSGGRLWSIPELAACAESAFHELEASPYFTATPTPWRGAVPTFTREQAAAGQTPPAIPRSIDLPFIVNAMNGTVLFAADEMKLSIINGLYPLMECGVLVIPGVDPRGTPTLLCLDGSTGKTLWTKSGELSEPLACLDGGPNGFLLGTSRRVVLLEARSGKELWSRSADPLAAAQVPEGDKLRSVIFTSPFLPGACFQAQQGMIKQPVQALDKSKTATEQISTSIQGWNIKDGQPLWAAPAEFAAPLGTVVPLQSGLLIGAADNGAFALLDARTGRSAWPSPAGGNLLKAPLTAAVSIEEGTLICTGKKNVMVFLFDQEGRQVWKEPVMLDGPLLGVYRVDGMLRLCSHEQSETRPTKVGPPFDYMRINTGYALNGIRDGLLVTLDKAQGRLLLSSPEYVKQLSMVEQEPTMQSIIDDAIAIEVLPEGYFLEGSTGVSMIGLRGELLYSKIQDATAGAKYRSPLLTSRQQFAGLSDHTRGAAFRAIGNSSVRTMVNQGMLTTAAVEELVSRSYGGYRDLEYTNTMRPRLLAAAASTPLYFMIEHGDGPSASIVAIRKSDGASQAAMDLGKGKGLNYAVDIISGTVVVAEGQYLRGFKIM